MTKHGRNTLKIVNINESLQTTHKCFNFELTYTWLYPVFCNSED